MSKMVRLANDRDDVRELCWNEYGDDVVNPRTNEKHRKIQTRRSVTLGAKCDQNWVPVPGEDPPRPHYVDISAEDFKVLLQQNSVVKGWIDRGEITVSAGA